ncbi:hypothetical protein BGZ74_005885 [Mortierella antarctica]|nr:hypothetical protein BGZ74_005885 [Mortierella antarctica]
MNNTLYVLTIDTQTIVSIRCLILKAEDSTASVDSSSRRGHCFKWYCTLTNHNPHLEISLLYTGLESFTDVRSFQIVSRNGTLVHTSTLNGFGQGDTLSAMVTMSSVHDEEYLHEDEDDLPVDEEMLDFAIVLSTKASVDMASVSIDSIFEEPTFEAPIPNEPRPAHDEYELPVTKNYALTLLQDITTMNMAFTFGLNGSARNVALWAHQSVLSLEPSLFSLFNKLKNVDGDPSAPEAVSGVKTTHVTEYSLDAYCALFRYLYTNEIQLEVDLNDFAIGRPPNKPFSPSCKKRPEVDGLFTPTTLRTTTWQELFSVADCYGVVDLRMYCFGKIVNSLTDQNVLDVYFELAYKYEDMKVIVLEYVFDSMDKLFAADGDPFEAYKDHPEKHSLMIKVMQHKFGQRHE